MKPRPLSLAQRRRLLYELPEIVEGPPPDSALIQFTGWTGTQIILQAGFEAFDHFPRPVRRALYEAVVTFDPRPIDDWLSQQRTLMPRRKLVPLAVRSIVAAEKADIAAFARQYRRKHGVPLPHVAAKASILRYRPARRRRPAGKR